MNVMNTKKNRMMQHLYKEETKFPGLLVPKISPFLSSAKFRVTMLPGYTIGLTEMSSTFYSGAVGGEIMLRHVTYIIVV